MNDFKFTENDVNLNKEYKEQLTPAITEKGIKAMQGYREQTSDSIDHGIIQVPVKDLPMPEGVNSPSDFNHHISWEDTVSAYKELPQIQADIASGKTADDLSQEDYEAGIDWRQGKKRVYDLFYGQDPVRLEKLENQYDIISGRHRVYAAKVLNLDTIPAQVIEILRK